jgi:hypothetical protein
MTITAAPSAAPADRSDFRTLTVVPAAFGSLPTPTLVTLHLSGHQPVTFTLEDFQDPDPGDPPHAETNTALTVARWLLESTGTLSPRDEATYVTIPLTDLHMRCATVALTNQQAALHSLRKVRSRTGEVLTDSRRSTLTRAAADQLDLLIDYLGVLAEPGQDPSNADRIQLQAQRAAVSVEQAGRIGEQARAIRDAPQP